MAIKSRRYTYRKVFSTGGAKPGIDRFNGGWGGGMTGWGGHNAFFSCRSRPAHHILCSLMCKHNQRVKRSLNCYLSRLSWATSWENLFMPYANNKDADQPAHQRSLISVFVSRCLDSITPLNFKPLASLFSWAGWFESYLVASSGRQIFSWRGYHVSWSKVKLICCKDSFQGLNKKNWK